MRTLRSISTGSPSARFVVDAGSLRFKFEIALLGALSILLGDEFRFAALVEESAEGFPVARVGKDFAQLGHLQRRVVAVELRDGDIEFEGHGTAVFVVANGSLRWFSCCPSRRWRLDCASL